MDTNATEIQAKTRLEESLSGVERLTKTRYLPRIAPISFGCGGGHSHYLFSDGVSFDFRRVVGLTDGQTALRLATRTSAAAREAWRGAPEMPEV